MTIAEQVYAQALLLAGTLEEKKQALLKILCQGAASSLAAQLREGLTPEDCKADFVAAASLLALASLGGASKDQVAQFQAGDFSIRYQDTASQCLRRQAELVISPYLKDRFTFLGV